MGKEANDAPALGASLPDYSASRKWAQPSLLEGSKDGSWKIGRCRETRVEGRGARAAVPHIDIFCKF